MSEVRILHGDTERIQTVVLKNGSLTPLTGLVTVVVAIQRTSDEFWLDWHDMTFKNAGWVTRQQVMSEVSAALVPGEYYIVFTTANIVNPLANETYMVTVDDTSGTAINVPLVGEIKCDQWVAGALRMAPF